MRCYVTSDLLRQIFHKLSVRSILRCMCVCKLWYSLIKDPHFISTNLKNILLSSSKNPGNDNQLFLVRSDFHDAEVLSLYVDRDGEFKEYLKLKTPFDCTEFKVHDTCNGLVLLFRSRVGFPDCYAKEIVLCNPMINKHFIVPRSRYIPKPNTVMIGLGFDIRTYDYKLLKLTFYLRVSVPAVSVDLFSVKMGCWRSVEGSIPSDVRILCDTSQRFVYVRGVLHYLGFRKRLGKSFFSFEEVDNVLLGFDMGEEVFYEIMLPREFEHFDPQYIHLGLYKGSSIMLLVRSFDGWRDFWVMKEYGKFESWTKLTFSERFSWEIRSLEWRNNGKLLCENRQRYFSIDPSCKEKEKYVKEYHDRILLKSHFAYVSSYIESLALMNMVKGEIYSKSSNKIFVGGIPRMVKEGDLKAFFLQFGNVLGQQIIRDRVTNRSRGFGFVTFESEDVVDGLLSKGNKVKLAGREVEIKRAESKKQLNQL